MHRRTRAQTTSRATDHKEGRATVSIFYKTGKTLADGSHPFQIRITKNRRQIYRSTGLSLHPRYWNVEKQEVRRNFPHDLREKLITDLQKWEDKYREAAEVLADSDECHDAGAVLVQAVSSRQTLRRVKLLTFTDELASGMELAGQVGNAGTYKDLRNQLTKFILREYGSSDVVFERVTVEFCSKWENVLRATGMKETTLSFRFRTLRAVLNKAIANGYMRSNLYPFARNGAEIHKFSIGKFDVSTTKRAVSREAIRRLEALTVSTERLQLARNVFMFSFYCGGINFVDLAQLRWRDLRADEDGVLRVHYERQKTGGRFSIKILAPVEAIVDFYRRTTFSNRESYLFPILSLATHVKPAQIKNRLHKILGQVNHDLKELAPLAGIDTPLTTYVARHSFATSLKRGGVTTGMISEAMGHKTEAVTAVYLGSFGSAAMDSVFDHLL